MALQICPNCQQQDFTWSFDEENIPPTSWHCSNCGYTACEDESFERLCATCNIKSESRLADDKKIYWWCSTCNTITIISKIPNYRYPTRAAIDFLAAEFNYRNEPHMQDWEYEVASAEDLDKYFAVYSRVNDDDIRFTLMMMIIEVLGTNDETNKDWLRAKQLLIENFSLHEYTVFYWCIFDNEHIEDCFYITPLMRKLWQEQAEKHP
ncbi:hypothetical protein [Chitinophaga sp. Cy-1792]|uniref:hypothetical protein n=1 Tax=Chitinophaga sp. Cy-1792 TaxID=2608339 RepID=UPI0014236BC6|nr:hypothetical protein [Chitinophaga sp. Cy-1792]NIG56960.1 hypothetical protein [Chitinophaga sp. Cy-1792]